MRSKVHCCQTRDLFLTILHWYKANVMALFHEQRKWRTGGRLKKKLVSFELISLVITGLVVVDQLSSPDLTVPDFFLWGYLKDIVYKDPCSTTDELWERVRAACAAIPKEMLQNACRSVPGRFLACVEAEGKHVL